MGQPTPMFLAMRAIKGGGGCHHLPAVSFERVLAEAKPRKCMIFWRGTLRNS